MPNIITEGNYIGDVLKWEVEPEYSREVVTIKEGTGKVLAGAVLEESEDGYVPLTAEGVPAAVLLRDVDATSADVTALVVARSAIVAKNKLVYNFSDDTSINKAIDGLKAIGIIAREGA